MKSKHFTSSLGYEWCNFVTQSFRHCGEIKNTFFYKAKKCTQSPCFPETGANNLLGFKTIVILSCN